MSQQIQIKSKDCKSEEHNLCVGHWKGLEIEVSCDCQCHKKSRRGPTKPTGNQSTRQDFSGESGAESQLPVF